MRAVGGAGSFSASPSANPAGRRKRFTRAGQGPVDEHAAAGLPGRGGRSRSGADARPRLGHRCGPPAPTPPAATGGAAYGVVFQPTVPGVVAQIVNGVAYAPDQAPDQVKQAIWAANQIVGMPYRLGGGHKLGFTDHAYDCSGTVSFAMHGAGLLAKPRDSSSFMRYGAARQGRVDHGLHQPRPRLRRHRGAAPGHERGRRSRRRLGPALAPEPALDARLPAPATRSGCSVERAVSALWLFLPVLGAPLLHAPVLRWDLLPALRRPLDGGRCSRGRRILGDNKTWRGALCMTAGVVLATLCCGAGAGGATQLPARGARVVAGAGRGAHRPGHRGRRAAQLLPQAPPRHRPGARRRSAGGVALALLDQGDLVLGIWVCLLPVWVMPVWLAAIAFVAIAAVHAVLNVVGYGRRARGG